MVLIMQIAASLVGFADSAAVAAALCVLVVLLWALSTRGSSSGPGKELKMELVDAGVLPSSPEQADANLDFGFEAFQASMERECDLALSRLCDDAVESQALRSLAEDLAGQALLDEQMGCEDVDNAPAGEPPTLNDGDPGLCFEDFEASKHELTTFRAQTEQHLDLALEGMLDLAIDGQCDMVLKNLENECRSPSALDDETLQDTFDLEEMEGALSRQAEEGRSLCADSIFNVALQEYHEQLLSELEMVNQQVPCKSLHEIVVQHIRRACSLYLLWVI
jgi:hypothetical protein